MNLTMYIPAKATGPVPMILTITFGGGGNKGFIGKAGAGKGDPLPRKFLAAAQ